MDTTQAPLLEEHSGKLRVRSTGYADLANRISKIQRNQQEFLAERENDKLAWDENQDVHRKAKETSSGSSHPPSAGPPRHLMRWEKGR